MLTTVEYTEKYMGIFLKYQGKMFLNIEKVLVKINEEQPYSSTSLVFSSHF